MPVATRARPLFWVLAVLWAVATLVCLAIGVLTLLRSGPVTGLGYLIYPAVALLVIGVGGILLDHASPTRHDVPDVAGRMRLLVGIGLLLALSGAPMFFTGAPDGGDATCPYRLRDHQTVRCVSEGTYGFISGSEQRMLMGIWIIFFSDLSRRAINRAVAPPGSAQP